MGWTKKIGDRAIKKNISGTFHCLLVMLGTAKEWCHFVSSNVELLSYLNLNFVSLFLSPRYGYNHKLLLTKLADQFFQLALQYLVDAMAVRITILFGI
jgi:hypothetical protein